MQLVKDWFEAEVSGQWLIILDNADDAEMFYGSGSKRLASYLPRSRRGSILMTTRFGKVANSFAHPRDTIVLSAMTLDEAKSLLSTRLEGVFQDLDMKLCEELSEEVERVPLALVQAASFMAQNSTSIEEYLEMYRRSDVAKIQLLSEEFEDDETRDPGTRNPIATTWIISFDYIKSHDSQAADLLSFMSMLDAKAIPEFLLPSGDNPILFKKALGTLQTFCFVTVRQEVSISDSTRLFDLHRLVRLATRNWLATHESYDFWTAKALKKLATIYLSDTDPGYFEVISLVLPHAIELLATERLQPENASTGIPKTFSNQPTSRFCDLNHALQQRSGRDERQSWGVSPISQPCSRACDLHHPLQQGNGRDERRSWGASPIKDPQLCIEAPLICPKCTLEVLSFVETWLVELHDYERCLSFAQRAYALKKHILGEDDDETLDTLGDLASAYELVATFKDTNSVAMFEKAKDSYRTRLLLSQAKHGLMDYRTLDSLFEFQQFSSTYGSKDEAQNLQQVLSTCCKELISQGENKITPALASIIARIQYQQGEWNEAHQSLTIERYQTMKVPLDHRDIWELARSAEIYENEGKFEAAESTLRRILEAQIEVNGPKHPDLARTMVLLAQVLRKSGKADDAREKATAALELTEEIFGRNSAVYRDRLITCQAIYTEENAT